MTLVLYISNFKVSGTCVGSFTIVQMMNLVFPDVSHIHLASSGVMKQIAIIPRMWHENETSTSMGPFGATSKRLLLSPSYKY